MSFGSVSKAIGSSKVLEISLCGLSGYHNKLHEGDDLRVGQI
jgi:hypothetical protein